jgi:hypothetical protein
MAVQKFDMSKLAEVNPTILASFQQELARVCEDIRFRPGERKVRKVALVMNVTPDADEEGGSSTVLVSFEISSNLPKKRTRDYSMEVQGADKLVFNPASPESIRQGTLDEVSDAKPDPDEE